MSALAQLLLAQNWNVSGSDRFSDSGEDLAILNKLRVAGVRLCPQDGSGVSGSGCIVIASAAVESTNTDIATARRLGAPVVGRAEMLARLAEGKDCIAVAGTSGKSTVTGMVGWILDQLGADPTVVNGGAVLNWVSATAVGNVRVGKSGPWVIETDESDKSLLRFSPDHAIITNIGKDHFDMAESELLFRTFAARVKNPVIGPESLSCGVPILSETFAGTKFLWHGVEFKVSLPGRHNLDNAIQTLALCEQLGFKPEAMVKPLAGFCGIERRLQVVGSVNGATVIDDFGHNPAKIRASWQSVAPHFGRILAVWRPHGFKPLEFMQDELIETIADVCRIGDEFGVLPVFYAGGTVERRVTSETFVAR
ncbi:MAG: Mur ligase family protein, partial [bacterium]